MQTSDRGRISLPYLPWMLKVQRTFEQHRQEGRKKGLAWGRFLFVNGGRRIRKTDLLLNRLIMKALESPEGSDLAYINKTIKQASLTGWKRLKAKLAYPNDWLVIGKPNENAKSVTLLGNRTIWFVGCEDPEAQRGAGFCHLGVDEASINGNFPQMWDLVFQPMLSDKMGTADFVMTPRGKGWTYQMWLKGCPEQKDKHDPSWLSFNVPSRMAGTIPVDILNGLERDMGRDWFQQEYECRFLDYVGLAAHQFLRSLVEEGGNILPRRRFEGMKKSMTFYGVIDYARSSGSTVREVFGVDPMGRNGYIGEMALPGGTPTRLAAKIREHDERLGITTLFNICGRDCWSKESNGMAMAEVLGRMGIACQPCPPQLEDAVSHLNELAAMTEPAEDGEDCPFFWVLEGECPTLVRQLCTVDTEDMEKKTQHMKDAFDCARMGVMMNLRALPTRRPVQEPKTRMQEILEKAARGRAAGNFHPISGRAL